jgi:polyphenol oxidase
MAEADFLKSPILAAHGFRNAFFTRRGGVSEGPFESLNFSVAVGDVESRVETNRALAASALAVAAEQLYFVSQVHGTHVVRLSGAETRAHTLTLEADAVTSANPEVACGVRTADCVPILLADLTSGQVAAVHAGWRGVAANIVVKALSSLGGRPKDWLAAIGPHISAAAFEVGEEVALELERCSAAVGAVVHHGNGKAHADLRAIVRAQLTSAGVVAENIDDVFGCTLLEPERFFSFRRDGRVSGRHFSAICARTPA